MRYRGTPYGDLAELAEVVAFHGLVESDRLVASTTERLALRLVAGDSPAPETADAPSEWDRLDGTQQAIVTRHRPDLVPTRTLS